MNCAYRRAPRRPAGPTVPRAARPGAGDRGRPVPGRPVRPPRDRAAHRGDPSRAGRGPGPARLRARWRRPIGPAARTRRSPAGSTSCRRSRPTELLDWVAAADVVAMPIQPSTLNHRLTTPNKLFEALAAGVPVVASDLPGHGRDRARDRLRPARRPDRPGRDRRARSGRSSRRRRTSDAAVPGARPRRRRRDLQLGVAGRAPVRPLRRAHRAADARWRQCRRAVDASCVGRQPRGRPDSPRRCAWLRDALRRRAGLGRRDRRCRGWRRRAGRGPRGTRSASGATVPRAAGPRFAHGRPTADPGRGLRGRLVACLEHGRQGWSFWPVHVRGWWATLERDLPPADALPRVRHPGRPGRPSTGRPGPGCRASNAR